MIERDGSLLLDNRLDPPGWGLVAVRLEDHESLAETLCREVCEETGLVVTSYELFGVFSHPSRIVHYADGNIYRVVTVAFVAAVERFGRLRPGSESRELRFVAREDVLALELMATHRPIIERYLVGGTPPYLD